MIEGDFVVPDDLVVKVGYIKCAIGPELEIDGAEPGIVASEQIGHLDRLRCRPSVFQSVAVDAAGHDITAEQVASIGIGKRPCPNMGDSRDGGAAMQMIHHRWEKP